MSCESTLPLLPLVALDAAEPADRTAALTHVAECARCAAALRELEAARGALTSFTVADAPATDATAIRDDVVVPRAQLHRASFGAFRFGGAAKAAAALLVVSLALGFAWLHGELTVERDAATLRIAWRTPARTGGRPAEDTIVPADTVAPADLAAAVEELVRHVSDLEARHERDLLLLADTVDRQQRLRDRGVERQIHSIEQQTRDGFFFTNEVLDHVVDRLARAGDDASSPPTDRH